MKCLFPLLLTVFLVVMVKRIYGEELPIEKVLDGVTKKERIEVCFFPFKNQPNL